MPVHQLVEVLDVFGLAKNETLTDLGGMWYHTFCWMLISSVIVHFVAAVVAFARFSGHKYIRFYPLAILLMGVVEPILLGSLTSLAIASVCRVSGAKVSPLIACLIGLGETAVCVVWAFSRRRLLATL